ncbi:MAG: prepilin-type N-terminal cleavage/methylation domain-containing protein [Burkholderiales bacterium]|jgi:general secretion pathway protein I|nr:prepilin-type N-terminal cleavage/methylation domain-containing protein [Burkholderiales bacterium]
MRAAHRSAGFTLLEVVVALAIMAIALGVLYRAVGGGVRTVGDLSSYSRAVAIGESVLQMREAVPAEGWNDAGEWQGFRWSVASAPYQAGSGAGVPLHRVQVDVGWSDGLRERSFSLVSLRPERVVRPRAGGR